MHHMHSKELANDRFYEALTGPVVMILTLYCLWTHGLCLSGHAGPNGF